MAEYLMPHNKYLNIDEKRNLFSIRNRMIKIENNLGKNEKCVMCDLNHIYYCEYLNEEEITIEYEKIFKGNLFEQIRVFRKFEKNLKKRNEEKSKKIKLPCDPFCDPLNSGKFSIG